MLPAKVSPTFLFKSKAGKVVELFREATLGLNTVGNFRGLVLRGDWNFLGKENSG